MTRFKNWLKTAPGTRCFLLVSFTLAFVLMLLLLALTGCANGANSKAYANDTRRTTTRRVTATGAGLAVAKEVSTPVSAPAGSNELKTPFTCESGAFTAETVTEETGRLRDTNDTPPTGKQIFGLWVGKFSAVAIICIVAVCFLAPSTVAAFLLKRLFAFRSAFHETVAGIESFKATGADTTNLKAGLWAAQTPQTRQLVAKSKEIA